MSKIGILTIGESPERPIIELFEEQLPRLNNDLFFKFCKENWPAANDWVAPEIKRKDKITVS